MALQSNILTKMITDFDSGTISVIDGSTDKVDININGFFNPAGLAYNSNNGKIYVTNLKVNTVSVVST